MEYLDGCNTAMRCVVRKMATVEGGLVWFGDGFTVGMLFLDRWTCIWQVLISASETSVSISEWHNIIIIGVTTFLQALNFLSSSNFELYLCSSNIQVNSAKLTEAPNLFNVSFKFTNMFSKTKAEVLTSHYPYDLQINLEEDAQPLVSPIYSFLASKQETLKEFIEENFNLGFIWPTFSLHGTLVLFVKKKDGSLSLYINFCSFNHISKKDCYSLLLISNLLDSSHKA